MEQFSREGACNAIVAFGLTTQSKLVFFSLFVLNVSCQWEFGDVKWIFKRCSCQWLLVLYGFTLVSMVCLSMWKWLDCWDFYLEFLLFHLTNIEQKALNGSINTVKVVLTPGSPCWKLALKPPEEKLKKKKQIEPTVVELDFLSQGCLSVSTCSPSARICHEFSFI